MSSPVEPENLYPPYRALETEHHYHVEDTWGTLPEGLRGTLYRNGPGRLNIGYQQLGHLFDGDGMVSMFRLRDGAVTFRNRYVRTRHYRQSLRSNRLTHRSLGTMRPGGFLANAFQFPANVANTNVVMHAGRLLALWEMGKPTELDPNTLDTVGQHDFGGELNWLGAFSAHPKWDVNTNEMFNFGFILAPRPRLVCYRIDRMGRMSRSVQLNLPVPLFNHDMGLTRRYVVFAISPLTYPLGRIMQSALGLCNFIDVITYKPSLGTLIALVPRDGGRPRIVHTEPLLHLHQSNAYDDGDDTVIELVHYHNTWEELGGQMRDIQHGLADVDLPFGGRLIRLRITPSGRVIREDLCDVGADFPTIDQRRSGRANRLTYLAAGVGGCSHPNAIAKVDTRTGRTEVHRFPHGHFVHEPVFAPRPGARAEDDGWLLVAAQDNVSGLANISVLDARRISDGPIFVGTLKHCLPPTFHGSFVAASQ